MVLARGVEEEKADRAMTRGFSNRTACSALLKTYCYDRFAYEEGTYDAQSDYADFVTVWHGYLIRLALQKNTPLTDEDMDLAVRIASDMWIVEQ